MSCLSCCGGCHGVLHVCPSLIPWADILESLMWRWNLLMTTKCPFEFTSHYLLLCSERCFLNQPHSRLLPILVWLSYWPLSSTCSCSLFSSLLLQPLHVFVCFLHLSQLDHTPAPPLPTVRPRQQAFFKDTWLWSVCLWASQAPVCNDVVGAAAAVCLFTFRSHLEFISDVFASRESLAETHHTHIYTCPVFLFSQACHHNDKIGDIPLLRSI